MTNGLPLSPHRLNAPLCLSLLSFALSCGGISTPDTTPDGVSEEEGDGAAGGLGDRLADRLVDKIDNRPRAPQDGPMANPWTLRGACQSVDTDLQALIPDGSPVLWFPDVDEDGFGDTSQPSSVEYPGATQVRGDCDDQDPNTHPGALDTPGDGVDADCGGSDTPQAHLGLSDTSALDLREALAGIAEGDTLWIGPGAWQGSPTVVTAQGISIRSTHGLQTTSLIGGGNEPIIAVREGGLYIEGITFTGGDSPSGGALNLFEAQVTVANCAFVGNIANQGGALAMDGGLVRLRGVSFVDNGEAGRTYRGGAIEQIRGELLIEASSFTGNTATLGGGIDVRQGSTWIKRTRLKGNRATRGGGLNNEGTKLAMIATSFEGNEALGPGGGLATESTENSSNYEFSNVRFMGNRADQGGGLYMNGDHSGNGVDTCMYGNDAREGGGAWLGDDASLYFLQLVANTATLGGGLYLADTSTSNQWVSGNEAEIGGGVYLEGAELRHSVISESVATLGGGLAFTGSGNVADALTLLENNAKEEGGGMWMSHGSEAQVKRLWIGGGRSGGVGGGMAIQDAALSGSHIALVGGSGSEGGGVWIGPEADVTLAQVVVVSNIATQGGGGGIALEGGALSITASILAHNSAVKTPNLLVNDGSLSAEYSTIFGGVEGADLGETVSLADPKLLKVPDAGHWKDADLHLSLRSPGVDSGGSDHDADDSPQDQGIFGGSQGGSWNADKDNASNYFWPGGPEDAPRGFGATEPDRDDLDPKVN